MVVLSNLYVRIPGTCLAEKFRRFLAEKKQIEWKGFSTGGDYLDFASKLVLLLYSLLAG